MAKYRSGLTWARKRARNAVYQPNNGLSPKDREAIITVLDNFDELLEKHAWLRKEVFDKINELHKLQGIGPYKGYYREPTPTDLDKLLNV